jgi:transcriptional regulator with XRE-family HTH domain
MKAIEIKEKRLLLGFTQKELAKRVGVSTQTINGYENGKEIPSTKYQILDTVLNGDKSNVLKKQISTYDKNYTENDIKILQLEERINEHTEISLLLKDDPINLKHQLEMIYLLKTQLDIRKKTNKEIAVDLKIEENLNKKK